MRILQPFLAEDLIPSDMLPDTTHWMGLSLKEILLLLGALALVTALLVLWAVYVRKTPRRHSHRHHHHHHNDEPTIAASNTTEDADSVTSGDKRYRRKRRRRREHRPRNPTLAETGGLPPIRPEGPADPLP